jgi:hypothetical protein
MNRPRRAVQAPPVQSRHPDMQLPTGLVVGYAHIVRAQNDNGA